MPQALQVLRQHTDLRGDALIVFRLIQPVALRLMLWITTNPAVGSTVSLRLTLHHGIELGLGTAQGKAGNGGL
ncbi:hypothetical protein D3C84_1272050 [compost metagenome]